MARHDVRQRLWRDGRQVGLRDTHALRATGAELGGATHHSGYRMPSFQRQSGDLAAQRAICAQYDDLHTQFRFLLWCTGIAAGPTHRQLMLYNGRIALACATLR